jgi:hypothetical protein
VLEIVDGLEQLELRELPLDRDGTSLSQSLSDSSDSSTVT